MRGVFRSWDTLVMSSALNRSLRIFSSTAPASPTEMLFRSSACIRRSWGISRVSTRWSRSPAAMARLPFRRRLIPTAHQHRNRNTAPLRASHRKLELQ